MPLLYVPMVWAFCIFLVQGFGDPLLLVALTFLTFSPLTYTIFGAMRRVTSPMSKTGVRSFIACVQCISKMLQVIALVCLVAYFVKVGMHLHEIQAGGKGIAAFLLEQSQKFILPLLVGQIDNIVSLITSGPLWSLIFTFLLELYLTAIVGADWMIQSSAEEWEQQGEEYLVELEADGMLDFEKGATAYHRHRLAYMEAMTELTRKRSKKKIMP